MIVRQDMTVDIMIVRQDMTLDIMIVRQDHDSGHHDCPSWS